VHVLWLGRLGRQPIILSKKHSERWDVLPALIARLYVLLLLGVESGDERSVFFCWTIAVD
jgi:hypothetical protein